MKDVSKFEGLENRVIAKEIIKAIGEPRNYGLTDEELEEFERKQAEERLAREAKEKADLEQKEAEERAQKLANWEEWVSKSQMLDNSNIKRLPPPTPKNASMAHTNAYSHIAGGKKGGEGENSLHEALPLLLSCNFTGKEIQ